MLLEALPGGGDRYFGAIEVSVGDGHHLAVSAARAAADVQRR
jgi:hypothetical protein